ncbi:bifunctional hydroxymethylpyrimidine kinase/phosphomethylpyrimidine kinase [Tepidibacillus fermentans]|uniref:Hydroxymethylpyrimidine/phosphomethylpyrimidine kinase n=1 Tax=Tepidibacillus fermentans TaxID=1281767 RepID=A0A4R3K8R6_9BACI|nr:bifunctional hydroxymethylpyrimidine kinase/phosphomethylpyrimidine kinase [Tepidibacillus fermentans]TCS79203.1 hydroxymethylpyrimidine/phosphomethylpyrimidine kinase [Tepidibacillus fermentans]
MSHYRALTIAGSDSGGGAGIQADLKTFTTLGVYGLSVITSITAQNTQGVFGIYDVPIEGVEKQIDVVLSDIGTDAIKIGMLSSSQIVQVVSEKLKKYNHIPIVVDPVMVAKGGSPLLTDEAKEEIKNSLFPLATVITPNIPEAEVLTGLRIQSIEDMKRAAEQLLLYGPQSVIIKGGHLENEAVDLFYDGEAWSLFPAKRIQTKNTHGTGCTFSSAIAAELAKGKELKTAIEIAKNYIQAAIEEADQLAIGSGHGPTNHFAYMRRKGLEVWN